VQYIVARVSTLLKQTHKPRQAEDKLSDADQLPHRLVSPTQYNRSLLSDFEQTQVNSDTLPVRGQLTPAYTYGSIS